MLSKLSQVEKRELEEALAQNGLRATRQREHVYTVLMGQRDHPTADEVYARAKEVMPSISLATVYNCLETLVECDLVKRLSYEREPSRFCPNDGDHAHFLDEQSGRVFDIVLPESFVQEMTQVLPKGFEAKKVKLSFTGYAPKDKPVETRVPQDTSSQ
mgnify:CR=1 FL=1